MAPSSSRRISKSLAVHPPLLVIPPHQTPHKSTLILLHGRGSNAETFSQPLLSTQLPSGFTFKQALPHTKFVFPTSLHRRAAFANRALITQWFDSYSLENLESRPEVEVGGLRESVTYLREMIREEVKLVGKGNVVLGGLSQGACVAVVTMLAVGDEGIGAVFGIAGRLPLRAFLDDTMDADEEDQGYGAGVVFEDDESTPATKGQSNVSPSSTAIQVLREELELTVADGSDIPISQIPVFLGHGVEDEKVPVQQGRMAVECLRRMGCDVTWREYADLEHWYHGQELEDIVNFLQERCNGIHTSRQPHT